jgi:2-oxoisovalerate dehydrogenase E1 component
MIFDRKNLTDNQLLDLYKRILKPETYRGKNVNLFVKVSKWFSGIGQEVSW